MFCVVETNISCLAQTKKMSALGRRLYLEDMSGVAQTGKTFTILVWKHGPLMEKRHIMRFGSERRHDPFEDCSVSNCRLTYDASKLDQADAVLFHLHRTKGKASLPNVTSPRPAKQRWVFLTDENPFHTFTLGLHSSRMRDFNGLFNWSMTYRSRDRGTVSGELCRMDSDVPVPSGRTLRLTEPERTTVLKRRRRRRPEKTKLAAIMISNCGGKNKRWQYVQQLRKHMPIDVYGGCGNLRYVFHILITAVRLETGFA
ncbi:hypothetical protein ANN_04869 [Periplaneta americana]|uniref:Fucosyltransferase n=1 Tax=Periplaneta americana TaxID=6978 RepID=A0ABQ8T9H4_PERAM|nr:hypothetical protein ANN_04869 [Periplaneta americana]